jgi:nucleolar MIF4G domain-containing protein 1
MQYGLWDLFKRMGEKSKNVEDADVDMDDEEDGDIDLRQIVNLGRMYGQLIADGALSLTSLKVCHDYQICARFMLTVALEQVLNFAYLQPKTKTFLEILLTTAFKQLAKHRKDASPDIAGFESAITSMLVRAKDTPQVITGLQFFLCKQVNPEELALSGSERKTLRKALKTAKLVLTQLLTSLS